MRRDGLAKLYDRLTPEERFRLYIEAIARGDEEEWRNLEKSCPRLVYEMNDQAYEDRVRASEEVTLAVCLDLAPRSQAEDAYGVQRCPPWASEHLSLRSAHGLPPRLRSWD